MTENYIVAVCTAKRPEMLRRCLASIAELDAIPGARISAVVVENDVVENSRSVVEEISRDAKLDVSYVMEEVRGIPFARNRALKEALAAGADWIALIDDDETARPDWLLRLRDACLEHGAEVANGPVYRILECEPPYWWERQKLKPLQTGSEIAEAPTNNILMAARIAAPDGLNIRFEERLTNGAEDIDFFRRVKAAGVKMIWVDEAYVDEFIPASRVKTGRLLNRLVMAACSGTQMKILREGYGTAIRDHLPKALRRMLVGGVSTIAGGPARLLFGEKGGKLLWYGITRVAKGYGNIKGLAGAMHDYYGNIDGH